MIFLALSKSKIFAIHLDIVIVDESHGELMFDLILGTGTLTTFGTVLYF